MIENAIPRPHESRLDPTRPDYAAIIDAHDYAVHSGCPAYRDPSTGLVVLTVAAHIARGTCCDSGCRHCPFVAN